ncbi:MAG: superoxide dismutase [Piptocephalis tieghemiana]|nr:MAG: superoxide dismutase [Piptocephalis tieghemiana]
MQFSLSSTLFALALFSASTFAAEDTIVSAAPPAGAVGTSEALPSTGAPGVPAAGQPMNATAPAAGNATATPANGVEQKGNQTASARIAMNGIEARVTFTYNKTTKLVQMVAQASKGLELPGMTPGGNATVQPLPVTEGFPFHIHTNPVGNSGNCSAAGGHWDPYGVNVNQATYLCNPLDPAKTCEVGDLSGKFGKLPPTTNNGTKNAQDSQVNGTDTQIVLDGERGIIGRSIVIHAINGSRIGCADIIPGASMTASSAHTVSVMTSGVVGVALASLLVVV